ncbi:hypothetical protein [Bdellovibrio sp. HCB337]|uniref:hypothetical protein n=1 Tax=Bdellovibrio sp. HCB337 TaxID=3394358 RepID=UPI0039A54E63
MKKYTVLFALSIFFVSNFALSATVSAVKNNKIMVSLEGESASPGSEFFVLNPQGKKVAIVKITQVKGDRALAEIVKGSAKQGYTLQSRGGGSGSMATTGGSDSYYDKKLSDRSHSGNSYGVVGGYLMNNMNINATGLKTNMSGSGFGALGYYDYALSPTLVARAMVGVEQYVVKGSNTSTSPVSCLADCNVNLNYLSMYGIGRWNFMQGQYKSWIGGGLGYLYPISKSSTAFSNASSLQANQIFIFSAGMDIRLSGQTYVPVSIEYGLFPTSSTVSANIIFLRAGYAWNL